eukprot:1140041-Pelagomonas_calceolata.AAC.2
MGDRPCREPRGAALPPAPCRPRTCMLTSASAPVLASASCRPAAGGIHERHKVSKCVRLQGKWQAMAISTQLRDPVPCFATGEGKLPTGIGARRTHPAWS